VRKDWGPGWEWEEFTSTPGALGEQFGTLRKPDQKEYKYVIQGM
jgi:hypothetical protein